MVWLCEPRPTHVRLAAPEIDLTGSFQTSAESRIRLRCRRLDGEARRAIIRIAAAPAQRPIIALMFVSASIFLGKLRITSPAMTNRSENHDDDDRDDTWDEEWHDDDAGLDPGDEFGASLARCPECGADVAEIAECCPACGYWLTDEDRHALWSSDRRPFWQLATAWLLLAMVLFGLVGIAVRLVKIANS